MLYSKALDLGLSCIPVLNKTGAAFIENWQQYSERLPTEEEVEFWDKAYPVGDKYGIAVVLGKASGLACSDIDVETKEVHDIVPKSIYGKRGLPGRATYFYKWSEKFKNVSESKTGVGFRCNNQYTIIAPSRHRKFDGQYVNLGKSILDLDRDELPELQDLEWMKKLPNCEWYDDFKNEGRNNRLKSFVTAMRFDGKTEEEIVQFIYDWDFKHHSPRLFTDPKEQFGAKSEEEALLAAYQFTGSITQSLIKSKAKIILPFQKIPVQLFDTKFAERPYEVPSCPPILAFISLTSAYSRFEITPLALGGALSMLAALASNRVRFRNTWPNEYFLALAPSGLGKGIVVSLLNELLDPTGLLGADLYRSTQSFIQGLAAQPNRLDVIDEAGAFFEAMKSSANYTSDLADSVNRLYSASNSKFKGISSVKHGERSGACNNPCVSIYATVHQTGFMQSVQGYLGSSGLMPRFLVFEQNKFIKNKLYNPRNKTECYEIKELLKKFIQDFFSVFPMVYDQTALFDASSPMNKKPAPLDLSITEEAEKLLEYFSDKYLEELLTDQEHYESNYVARKVEHLIKLSMLLAVGWLRTEIQKDDILVAQTLLETCFYNGQLIRKEISSSGLMTGVMAKVESCLKRHGKIPREKLIRIVNVKTRMLDEALEPLIESGKVLAEKTISLKTNRPARYYSLLEK